MNEIAVIKSEALKFYRDVIERSGKVNAIDDFKLLKSRLDDFYYAKSKAIFLDQIAQRVIGDLEAHVNNAHGGVPDENCPKDKKANELLFYINQELSVLPVVIRRNQVQQKVEDRNDIFISYSHKDKEILEEVQRHFRPVKDALSLWDDTKMKKGGKWREQINSAIENAKVAILLVSTDFLGSDFIMNNELPPLLQQAEQGGTTILTLVLKPCLFDQFEELNQYQTVNPPDSPISKMDDNEREELFVELAREVLQILNS